INFADDQFVSDGLGHGTHVAGIAGGNGAQSYGSGNFYGGIAPGANLYNLRVFTNDGEGHVSNVLAAIDWILANHASENIRVVNMSLGTPVVESYKTDPLCIAVEKMVNAGIVVVVAAGNFGKDSSGNTVYGGILSPANDPEVITVGAANTFGTDQRSDDTVTTYSSRGPTLIDGLTKPDLVAPGNKIISVSAPGNYLLQNFPSAASNLPGYMVLSGTSMAAPVVAGGAALMLQANPSLTPRVVKAILKGTAQTMVLPGLTPYQNLVTQGTGEVNILSAVRLALFAAGNVNQLKAGSTLLPGGLTLGMLPATTAIAGEQIPFINKAFVFSDGVILRGKMHLFDKLLLVHQVTVNNGIVSVHGNPIDQ